MRFIISFIFILICNVQLAFGKPQCENEHGIWVNEENAIRYVVYGTYGISYGSDVYFEEWRGSKLAWRAKATVTCSNGASICFALVENASGLAGGDKTTNIVIEQIDEDADGLSEWVVFAALRQIVYGNGGAKVEWFNGFAPKPYERITMPNIYHFLDCRSPGKLKLYLPESDSTNTFLKNYLARFNDRHTKAFIKASLERTPRVNSVVEGMNEFLTIEQMIKDRLISSPADCLPELRILCFDVIKDPSGETVVQEWNEWVDNLSEEELIQYIADLTQQATERGFNLLTDSELESAFE